MPEFERRFTQRSWCNGKAFYINIKNLKGCKKRMKPMIDVNTLIKITSNTLERYYIHYVFTSKNSFKNLCFQNNALLFKENYSHKWKCKCTIVLPQSDCKTFAFSSFFFFFFILCCVLLLAEKSLANSRIPGCRAKARY